MKDTHVYKCDQLNAALQTDLTNLLQWYPYLDVHGLDFSEMAMSDNIRRTVIDFSVSLVSQVVFVTLHKVIYMYLLTNKSHFISISNKVIEE